MGRQRGSIEKRGDAWRVSVYVGPSADGRREYRRKTVSGSKRAAQRELTKMLGQVDAGTIPSATRETLDTFLDRWLESKTPSLSPRTAWDYKRLLATHVRPKLGKARLAEIRPRDVQRVYDAMTARGLSGRTVHVTHNVLRQALAQAVRWRDLAVNPAEAVVLPRWERREMMALGAEQVRSFLEHAEGDPMAAYFHLAFATGMRPAELLGLRWEDVDLAAGQIHVRRALERVRGRPWRLKEPKAHSLRTIPVPKPVIELLRALRAEQGRAKLARRPTAKWREHGLVFPGRYGDPMEDRNLAARHLKPILRAAKLPEAFRLYDTRHTCATLLAAAGENPRVISDRLGHAGIQITLDVYTHVSPGMQESATGRLDRAMYGGGE